MSSLRTPAAWRITSARVSLVSRMREYARDIWGIEPCRRPQPAELAKGAGLAAGGSGVSVGSDGSGRVRSFPSFDPPAVSGDGGAALI